MRLSPSLLRLSLPDRSFHLLRLKYFPSFLIIFLEASCIREISTQFLAQAI
jgi:hypothetical protein